MSSGPADAIRVCWDGWFGNWYPHECQDPVLPCRILDCSKCHLFHLSVVLMLQKSKISPTFAAQAEIYALNRYVVNF